MMAIKSSITAKAVKNTFIELGTLEPNAVITPIAKAISVAVGIAVLAKFHNIPFYVAAPYSTFDFTLENGSDIPIEMRDDYEVTSLHGVQTAPKGIDVLNPAFDVTPHELVTAIITEEGVLKPNYEESIDKLRQIVESK